MATWRLRKLALALAALGAVSWAQPVRSDQTLERSALDVLAAERRNPELAAALGSGHLRVVHVGHLNANGRRLGATMLVALAAPRRGVHSTVPAYVPAADNRDSPYTLQRVRMRVAVLRDALIDIDLRRRRVIALEPGPSSQTLKWSESKAPAPAGAADED